MKKKRNWKEKKRKKITNVRKIQFKTTKQIKMEMATQWRVREIVRTNAWTHTIQRKKNDIIFFLSSKRDGSTFTRPLQYNRMWQKCLPFHKFTRISALFGINAFHTNNARPMDWIHFLSPRRYTRKILIAREQISLHMCITTIVFVARIFVIFLLVYKFAMFSGDMEYIPSTHDTQFKLCIHDSENAPIQCHTQSNGVHDWIWSKIVSHRVSCVPGIHIFPLTIKTHELSQWIFFFHVSVECGSGHSFAIDCINFGLDLDFKSKFFFFCLFILFNFKIVAAAVIERIICSKYMATRRTV